MTVLPPDPYKILGVSKDAQIPEIRSAHRKLVLRCHPDKVQDPTLKAEKQIEFQQVQQAYELLSDEKERQRYDDQARLAELKKKMAAAKANSSAPRATPYTKVEIRTAEPRASTFKSATGTPPKASYTYRARSFEEDPRAPHIFEVKREPSFEKSSKRDRDFERERDLRDRDSQKERESRERERERKQRKEKEKEKEKEEIIRRALEKEAKEARRAEKRQREKERDKEKKREMEEKKRPMKPYVEDPYGDEVPVPIGSGKKKSSKKHEEKREPSSHREEPAPTVPPPMPQDDSYKSNLDQARSYIRDTRSKPGSGIRAKHMQQPPAAPTPPPASSPFAVPDEDVRRSSAKARRGSSGSKSFRKSSKEVLDDDDYVPASPSARHAAREASGNLSSSPRRELPRQNTMPMPTSDGYTRPIPGLSRSYTDMDPPRGRDRSKMQSQIYAAVESDEEYDYSHERDYERRHRKHRSSKKNRSPSRNANMKQTYRVDGIHATLQSSSYVRNDNHDAHDYASYYQTPNGHPVVERPGMYREHSYSRSAYPSTYPKVKTSPSYEVEDVTYSRYPTAYEESAY